MTITELKELLKQFDTSSIRELQFSDGNSTLYLNKNEHKIQTNAQTTMPEEIPISDISKKEEVAGEVKVSVTGAEHDVSAANGQDVTSPLVGMVYTSPSPDSPSFVSVGQKVTKGETLCIVEAMKIMNDIPSPVTGIVTASFIKNDTMVEYGQPLFQISQEEN